MKYEKWPPTHMAQFWNIAISDDKLWINLAWPIGIFNMLATQIVA